MLVYGRSCESPFPDRNSVDTNGPNPHRNYKSTESDLENEEEVDSDDDDPSNWFEDDQDDGRKFQNIVEPDMQDLSRIIQVDYSRLTSGQPAPT